MHTKVLMKKKYISLYKEFIDGFYPHTILNSNEGIMLYTLTLQQIDSRIDKSIHTYPVGCDYKGKDYFYLKKSYIKSLNNIEYSYTINKYYSKKHRKYVPVVFMCAGIIYIYFCKYRSNREKIMHLVCRWQ